MCGPNALIVGGSDVYGKGISEVIHRSATSVQLTLIRKVDVLCLDTLSWGMLEWRTPYKFHSAAAFAKNAGLMQQNPVHKRMVRHWQAQDGGQDVLWIDGDSRHVGGETLT